jgi:hypothetical protein
MKWIVTSPIDIKANEPIEVEGPDRLNALVNIGFTVWEPEEWTRVSERFKHAAT